jgi:oligopeptide transport system ATP-binding protein
VAVMYLGRIVEIGDVTEVFERPTHPYTQALLSAVPIPDPRKERTRQRILLQGDLPSPLDPPQGCRFRPRCQRFANELADGGRQVCHTDVALEARAGGSGHLDACHHSRPAPAL